MKNFIIVFFISVLLTSCSFISKTNEKSASEVFTNLTDLQELGQKSENTAKSIKTIENIENSLEKIDNSLTTNL